MSSEDLKNRAAAAWQWVREHKKAAIAVAFILVVVLVSMCQGPAAG
jgi:hypothetical protein